MTEEEIAADVLAAAEAEQEAKVRRKFLRITSSLFLDWPEHGFVLHATDSQRVNDFAQPEEIPEAVAKKLHGFIRSGHVKIYVITELHDGSITSIDQTPTAEELAEDDDDEQAPPVEGETPQLSGAPATPAELPPAPAEQPAPTAPTTPTEAAAPPVEGETPAS